MICCISCRDRTKPRECKIKGCRSKNDPRCADCHAELYHGAIPDVTGDGRLGGNPRGGIRSREPSPWGENNVKLMEDGHG